MKNYRTKGNDSVTGKRTAVCFMLALLLFVSACAFPGKSSSSGTAAVGETQAAESSAAAEESDWRLILVNRWNPLPSDYQFEKEELSGGQAVDARIYPELQQMFDDARAEGVTPHISSSYRTNAEQQEIMDDKIAEYESEGYSADEAKTAAEKWVAIPGTSEHELGLAVDITTNNWDTQDANIVWDWLNENCWKYGFIRRYPEDKTDITGVINEPWHYRYVGKEAAKEIMEQGICLEEYLGKQ